jgi:hypothetical protein
MREFRREPIETLRRRPPDAFRAEKARERRAGEILLKPFAGMALKERNPTGATSDVQANRLRVARDARKGKSPEAAAPWLSTIALASVSNRGQTAGGFNHAETRDYLASGESSEGRIPRAPPVRNRTGTVAKGASRHEGNQTLKAERSGQAKLAVVDLRILMCCREQKLMRGAVRCGAG